MDILRFITAGSVDDGKSTLIGRLLHDSKAILIDQLAAIEQQRKKNNSDVIDLSLLTDGLRAEREQGITIDVAYKYFSTDKRKFIIGDAPGHIQYTRNMITGASNADLIIILVDARNGVVEQTKRHSIIAALLGISHVLVAINKIDLVNFSQEVFDKISKDYSEVAESIGLKNITFIPISAKNGDNIVRKSENINWYQGESLLHFLEHVEIQSDINLKDARFPVQYVIRPQGEELKDYRGYAGKIISGIYKKGDRVTILPSYVENYIKSIELAGNEVTEAFAPQSVVIQLEDEVDVSRGDLIVKSGSYPKVGQELEILLTWMDSKPLAPGNKYWLQINSHLVKTVVKEIEYRVDINTLQKEYAPGNIGLNDIVNVKLKTATPVPYDSYSTLKVNGGAILIDETSHVTVGAGILK